jgi:signal transduction histidine kinase
LGRIFKPGTQAKSDLAPNDQHLGLGLFIVDKIVSAHGGTIDVTSTDATGTTFTIRLPRAS